MKMNRNRAPISRRQALIHLGSAGAGLMLFRPPMSGRLGTDPQVAAAAVSPRTIRLRVLPAGTPGSQSIPLDGALVDDGSPQQSSFVGVGLERVAVGEFRVSVARDPLRIGVSRPDGRVVQQLGVDGESGALWFDLGDGPLLGMGEGGSQFDRRGSVDRMQSGQGGYELRTHGGRVPIQWLVSTDGWALYIHQPLGALDLSGPRGRFDPPEGSRVPLDVFVVDARDPVDLMAEWARLTGRPELPPLWSLGYQQSHRTLSGPDEVLHVARTFREKQLPCDTLIYLGTGLTPAGWNTQNGEFTWNPATFPDPQAALDELHALHFRVVLHVVLEGRRLTGTVRDPCPDPPAPGATGSGRTWPDEQRVSCYWPVHRSVFEQGVDGWWPAQATASTLRRVSPESGCIMKAPSSIGPASAPSRCTATGTQAWPATPRSSGRETCTARGRPCAPTSRSRSTPGSAGSPFGVPTSAASCRPLNTRASCTSAGSSSAPSAPCSAHMAAPASAP